MLVERTMPFNSVPVWINPGLLPATAMPRFQPLSGYTSSDIPSVVSPRQRGGSCSDDPAFHGCAEAFGSQSLVLTRDFYGIDSAVCTVW